MIIEKKTMRDVFIERICNRMESDRSLFFLSADFGSPKLDKLRADHPDRFVNVGIAEQNLVNVATGLALEGYTVYAYAIAPFMIMRAYEQIRNNLSLLSHTHQVNVNLVGVGGGLSYDVSGPTHHSMEDISIIRTLPNMTVFSPSDWVLAEQFADHTIAAKTPKYLRFDGKPLPNIHDPASKIDLKKGFIELVRGEGVCIVSTGYMTRAALLAVERLAKEGIKTGLIDVFLIKPLPEQQFLDAISGYQHIVTVEEGFAGKGGLDSLAASILNSRQSRQSLTGMGFGDAYVFEMGSRDSLHALSGIDEQGIAEKVRRLARRGA
jgi:transketolase